MRVGKLPGDVARADVPTPFVEDLISVDMREKVINVEPQKVITKDNVSVTVDAVIYYKVHRSGEGRRSRSRTSLRRTTLAQTNLRNLIGDSRSTRR
jgi:regulator of protease activity HflC (stomatin/prohibitin superfamily)